MENLFKSELGIIDTRRVVQTIWDKYGFDLKDYALTSLKRRLEHTIAFFGLSDAEALISKLQKEKDFFEVFINVFEVETTEYFRDPSVWRVLRDTIIPELIQSTGSAKLFVPLISSGEELYSLAVLLRESGIESSSQLYASAYSNNTIEKVVSGQFNYKKLEFRNRISSASSSLADL